MSSDQLNALRKVGSKIVRQMESFANGLRFGFLFTTSGQFKIPSKVRCAGRSHSLHYPAEGGNREDFFVCIIRNEYGLRRGLSEVRTIVDVGGNVGLFSVAARNRYPDATIHVYEPNPRMLSCLELNTAELGITVYPEAVGGQEGFVDIVDLGDSNQARTTNAADGPIAQVGLDTVVKRAGDAIDLLKLDCEGAEWELFKTAAPWEHIRNVRMEYHLFHGETVEQLDQTLRNLGFETSHWQHDIGFGTAWARRPELYR